MTLTIPGAAQFDGRRLAVLGMGKSGRAVVETLLTHTEAVVGVWDASGSAVVDYESSDRIDRVFFDADPDVLLTNLLSWGPDTVIIAPAFRQTGPEWAALSASGVDVWSEIELAWRLRAARPDGSYAPWLAITGTNGKTTTVSMLESILQVAGLRGKAVGNVGVPAVSAVADTSDEAPLAFALELSSFQLAATSTMQPTASVCLNIADDHLEWHRSRTEYRDAKANVYNNVEIACLYPVGDTEVQDMVDDADVQEGARAIGLTMGVPGVGQIGFVDDVAVDRAFIKERHTSAAELFTVSDLLHLAPGGSDLPLHIAKDALAAAGLARSIGVEPLFIRDGLRSFAPGQHRIEHVATVDGVTWIDDSKATNAHAARASLLAQPEHSVVWIAGGQPKGARFKSLVDDVRSRLRAVVVIGTDQEPWRDALADADLPVTYVDPDALDPMNHAVRAAAGLAHPGDVVLLAPASASMDQFTSYAERGEKFAAAVQSLGAQ